MWRPNLRTSEELWSNNDSQTSHPDASSVVPLGSWPCSAVVRLCALHIAVAYHCTTGGNSNTHTVHPTLTHLFFYLVRLCFFLISPWTSCFQVFAETPLNLPGLSVVASERTLQIEQQRKRKDCVDWLVHPSSLAPPTSKPAWPHEGRLINAVTQRWSGEEDLISKR